MDWLRIWNRWRPLIGLLWQLPLILLFVSGFACAFLLDVRGYTGHGMPTTNVGLFGAPSGFFCLLWIPVIMLTGARSFAKRFTGLALLAFHWVCLAAALFEGNGSFNIEIVTSEFYGDGSAKQYIKIAIFAWLSMQVGVVIQFIGPLFWKRSDQAAKSE